MASTQFMDTWRAWWLGDSDRRPTRRAGVADAGVRTPLARRNTGTPRKTTEATALGLATAAVTLALFSPVDVGLHSMIYLFPPLTWAALRFGPRGASLTTTLGLRNRHLGHGPGSWAIRP